MTNLLRLILLGYSWFVSVYVAVKVQSVTVTLLLMAMCSFCTWVYYLAWKEEGKEDDK